MTPPLFSGSSHLKVTSLSFTLTVKTTAAGAPVQIKKQEPRSLIAYYCTYKRKDANGNKTGCSVTRLALLHSLALYFIARYHVLIFHVIVGDCNCRVRRLKPFLVSPRKFTSNKSGYTD